MQAHERTDIPSPERGAGDASEGTTEQASEEAAKEAADLRAAELEELVRELDTFAYTVAHDLRAPLRTMRGFSQTLLKEYGPQLDARGRNLTERIDAAGKRMDTLIGDLLHYSRISRRDVTLGEVDLQVALHDVLDAMNQHLVDAHAAVEVQRPLPVVTGNRVLITQALGNLISNAIKFVPEDVRPLVRIRPETKEGSVRIWVEDNGIGIDPKHHERLFGLFERLHGRDEYGGTGIGLATVRRALERMGGTVGLESEPGQGSRFWIELPTVAPSERPGPLGRSSPLLKPERADVWRPTQ